MRNNKKQLKINKLFRKGGTASKPLEDCNELQDEVQQLERKLTEKQNELFQLQRNSLRHKASPLKKRTETFTRPQKIILTNSVETLKRSMELMAMLTSTEVQSYVAKDHCCVVFHVQHESQHEIKHGLRIDMKSGVNEISACSLPLGFNLSAVMEDYDNVMKPECLGAVRKALVAYYDRLEQYQALKKLVNIEAELFKTLDGSHMEISLRAASQADEEEQVSVVLMLDYRVYDIRPKNYSIKRVDLPEEAADALMAQCAVFKRKPLNKAFKEAFLDGIGHYKLVEQVGRAAAASPRPKRLRPNKHRHNDDTFRPDECSDQGEDDDHYLPR